MTCSYRSKSAQSGWSGTRDYLRVAKSIKPKPNERYYFQELAGVGHLAVLPRFRTRLMAEIRLKVVHKVPNIILVWLAVVDLPASLDLKDATINTSAALVLVMSSRIGAGACTVEPARPLPPRRAAVEDDTGSWQP